MSSTNLWNTLIFKKKRYIKRIPKLFRKLDNNDSKKVSVNQFFELIDVVEKNPFFQLPMFPDFYFWDIARKFLNKSLKFKVIAKSVYFELFMLIVLLANCIIIIWGAIETDIETLKILDLIDDIILYFYIGNLFLTLIFISRMHYKRNWFRHRKIL